jgi:hypothetical protein
MSPVVKGEALLAPFVPPQDWIDAFEAQCTPKLLHDALRVAAHRARSVQRAGGVVDNYYERELVQDALADTALGVLRWNPSTKSLEAHVGDAIRTRTSHDRIHAKKFHREPIDALAPHAHDTLMAEIQASLGERAPDASLELATHATDRLTALRELAAHDPIVLRMLDAFAAGATTKAEVMLMAKMSDKEYHAARARLGRLVAKLFPHSRSSRRTSPTGD